MSKRSILGCNVLPQAPAATGAYLCIPNRCMILIPINSTFCTASVCYKYQIIFSKCDLAFSTVFYIFNSFGSLLFAFNVKTDIGNAGAKLDLYTCCFQILLHWKDQGFVLIVPGKFQSREIWQSANMVDKTLEITLHFQSTVPVFKSKHGAPVQPEIRTKYFIIKEIFNGLVIQVLIPCKEQLHDLHTAFLA